MITCCHEGGLTVYPVEQYLPITKLRNPVLKKDGYVAGAPHDNKRLTLSFVELISPANQCCLAGFTADNACTFC